MSIENDLRRAAEEIRAAGHNGWGNTCEQAADRIAALEAALIKANGQAEHLEREWYLCGDKLERAEAELEAGRDFVEELAVRA